MTSLQGQDTRIVGETVVNALPVKRRPNAFVAGRIGRSDRSTALVDVRSLARPLERSAAPAPKQRA